MNIKKQFSNKSFKNGSYSTILVVIVLAIVIVLNLVVNNLPSSMTSLDMSSQKLYTVSEDSMNIINNLQSDITLYLVAETGSEDNAILPLLRNYESLSSHIKVQLIDPVTNPTFLSKYDASDASANSVVVEGADRYKVIKYDDIYETQYKQDSSSAYGYSATTNFDGEGEITSAIDYVTTSDLPIMYVLTGHNEQSLSDTIKSDISKRNIETKELNLLTTSAIPEDADALAIIVPSNDLTAEETTIISNYLNNGGKAIIVSQYVQTPLPNFKSILSSYGMDIVDGIVVEGDANNYYRRQDYIVPTIESTDITTNALASKLLALTPDAQGIVANSNVRSTVTIENLLTTSDSSFSITDYDLTDMTKGENDIAGPFAVAATASETLSNGQTTKLALFTSYFFISDEITQTFNVSNLDIFMDTISWMCEQKSPVSISTKSLSEPNNSITAAQANFWMIVTVIVVPLTIVVCGFVIWFRRRKR